MFITYYVCIKQIYTLIQNKYIPEVFPQWVFLSMANFQARLKEKLLKFGKNLVFLCSISFHFKWNDGGWFEYNLNLASMHTYFQTFIVTDINGVRKGLKLFQFYTFWVNILQLCAWMCMHVHVYLRVCIDNTFSFWT